MARFVALLRGVSPMNLKMPDLKRCLEKAGYTNVKTILSSGNVAFDTRSRSESALADAIEKAMQQDLGRTFPVIVRSSQFLQELVASDPFSRYSYPAGAKRVVTFLREKPKVKLSLPIEADGAVILAVDGLEVLTAYVPGPKGGAFMGVIEKAFGKDVTTRTWETVTKCAKA